MMVFYVWYVFLLTHYIFHSFEGPKLQCFLNLLCGFVTNHSFRSSGSLMGIEYCLRLVEILLCLVLHRVQRASWKWMCRVGIWCPAGATLFSCARQEGTSAWVWWCSWLIQTRQQLCSWFIMILWWCWNQTTGITTVPLMDKCETGHHHPSWSWTSFHRSFYCFVASYHQLIQTIPAWAL